MAGFGRKIPWTRQPQYPVSTLKTGIGKGLRIAVNGMVSGGVNAVTGRLPTTNTLSPIARINGINIKGNANTGVIDWADGVNIAASGQMTVLALTILDGADWTSTIFYTCGAAYTKSVGYWAYGTGTQIRHNLSGYAYSGTQGAIFGTRETGKPTLLGCVVDFTNDKLNFWVDGAKSGDYAPGAYTASGTQVSRIYGDHVGASHATGIDTNLILVWDRILSDAEMKSITRDNIHGLIYASVARNIWVPSAGGGSIIDLSTYSYQWNKQSPQLNLKSNIASNTFNFSAKSTQNTQIIKPTTSTLTETPQVIQNSQGISFTAAAMNFIATSISFLAGAVIDLTNASLFYLAKTLQLTQSFSFTLGNLFFSPKSILQSLKLTLSKATLGFTSNSILTKLALFLGTATLYFISQQISVTGAIASAVARLLALMGVGS